MNLFAIVHFLAQAAQPTSPAPGTQEPPFWANPQMQFMIILFGGLILMMFLTRSAKRTEERKRTEMLDKLSKGDRVQTVGGILGTVVEVRDSEVLVKVDESSNTKIRFSRTAIHRVVEEEKASK